jgi:hypothetical protein
MLTFLFFLLFWNCAKKRFPRNYTVLLCILFRSKVWGHPYRFSICMEAVHFDAVPVRICIFSSSLSQRQGNLITEGNSGKWEHGIWTSPSQLTPTLQTTATLCRGAVDTTVLYIRVCLQCRCLAWRWQSSGNFTLGLALSFTMLENMGHGHSKLVSWRFPPPPRFPSPTQMATQN